MQDTVARPSAGLAASPPRSSARGSEPWRLNVLGPVELCFDTRPVEVSGIARDLLALLARTAGQEVSTASIIANLWGTQPPDDAQNVVASQVSRLRKALTAVAPDVDPTGVVVTMPTGYVLHIGASNVDAETFERLLADGRQALAVGQPALAISRLDAGLRLWRGAAYSDFDDQPFTRAEAQRLEDLRLAAIESRVEARLALTAPDVAPEMLSEVQALLTEHWHRERLWVHLMTALFRQGRRGDALAALRQAEARLVEDLTIEPGPELRFAERAVLNNDPALYGVPLRPSLVPTQLAATAPTLLGREQEIEWLVTALDMAATRRAQARLVVGSAGLGKTRLMAELAQQVADRGVAIRYGHGDPESSASLRHALVVDDDRLNLIVLDDLDLGSTEDVLEVVRFVRSHVDRPVLTVPTCRDPVRVGELAALPKLVLTTLGDNAIAEIVRIYAPSTTNAAAVAAMVNAGGVPARLHRAASEWAFNRAGRRIDRAAASAAEPTRWLTSVRDEVVAGILELDHVRRSARPLRPTTGPVVGCPYRGLARYEAADADLFRGRERAAAEVVARIVDAPLLTVIGAAGTGKSSLVRAGVLPAVAAGVLPDSARWRQLLVTPFGAAELALRLAEQAVDELSTEDKTVEPELAELADVADFDSTEEEPEPESNEAEPQKSTVDVPTAPTRTLLVVDQLEEAFTLVPAARAELFSTIVEAAASGQVSVLLVLRSDAYPGVAEHPDLAKLVAANSYALAPMSEPDLRRAIEEPAALAGTSVEPDLVDVLIGEAAAAGLPALSAGLTTLWAQRDDGVMELATYRATGGLSRAIEHAAERAYRQLSPAQEAVAAQVLVSLAENGHVAGAGGGAERAATLARLAEHGMVSIVDGQVELIHEALVENWPRLRGWMAKRQAERELGDHLSESTRAWTEAGRTSEALYGGARLAAALDYADGRDLPAKEREFLAAGERVLMAADLRRRQQATRLWYAILVLALLLTTALAASGMLFVAWRGANAANQRAGAVRVAQSGQNNPDLRQALRLTAAAATVDNAPETVNALRAALLRSPDLTAMAGEGVRVVAVSADGALIAAGSANGTVVLLHAPSLNIKQRLAYPGPVAGLTFTPDGRTLVAWGDPGDASTGAILVWDVQTGALVGTAFGQSTGGARPTGGGVLADGDTLMLARPGGAPVAWSLSARTPSTAYALPPGPATTVLVSPDGSAVLLSDGASATIITVPTGHTSQLSGVGQPLALNAGGRSLLSTRDGAVDVWDVATGARTGEIKAGDMLAGAWSADSSAFAVGGRDGTIVVYDAHQMSPILTLAGDRLPIQTVHFGADGHDLYTSSDSGALMAWDLTQPAGQTAAASTEDSSQLLAHACRLAGRDLTPAEWTAAIPEYPYRQVC
jgi:DNA-binding SARP family transcriptional activator